LNVYEFLDSIGNANLIPHNDNKWIKSKEYYMNVQNCEKQCISWQEPKYAELHNYLVNEKKFDEYIVSNKINELKKMHEYYKKHGILGPYNVIRRQHHN
jgi:hypothetical protein